MIHMNLHRLLENLPSSAPTNPDSPYFHLRVGQSVYRLPWTTLETGDVPANGEPTEDGVSCSCAAALVCLLFLSQREPSRELLRADLVRILMALGHSNGNCYIAFRRLEAANVIARSTRGVVTLSPITHETITQALTMRQYAKASTH